MPGMSMEIDKQHIETLYETRFLKCYDLQYAEGKHYYEASRRERKDLVASKADDEFRGNAAGRRDDCGCPASARE